jgi:hypothetical protein
MFIKKSLIGTILLLLVVVVFWKTLTATAFWGLAMYQTKDLNSTKITPNQELTLPTATSTATTTVYGSVQIPHWFERTDVLQSSDGVRTIFSDRDSNAYYIISTMGAYKDGFLAGHTDKTSTEMTTFCQTLTTTFTTNPCQSDRAFLTTTMEAANKTARLFSSYQRKNAAATFLLVKAVYIPGATSSIFPFQTATVSGHIAYHPRDSIVYFFDSNETGYEIVFADMDQAEIEAVLASITNDV